LTRQSIHLKKRTYPGHAKIDANDPKRTLSLFFALAYPWLSLSFLSLTITGQR
jgi:hypothetical protein